MGGEEAHTNLFFRMFPHTHVSNAFLELVKRKFQEVIALMSKLLPPYEASVRICSYLNNQNNQMSKLEATLALIGVSEANSKHQNEKIPRKVKNVFISSRVSCSLLFLISISYLQ